MPRQLQGAQRDFSFGEIDPDLKRADDHPARKAGLRRMENWRIHNSGSIQQRSGRSAKYPCSTANRTERITMSSGNDFYLGFGHQELRIFNAAGAQVALFAAPWTAVNIWKIVYDRLRLSIYITYPGMVPKVVSWDGVATWTMIDYAEQLIGGQKRTPFYRLSPQGITLLPSGRTGNITLTASAPIFSSAYFNVRLRFVGRQILIGGLISAFQVTGTVQETLPGHQNLGCAVDPTPKISIGDVIVGVTSGSKGIVTAISAAAIDVQLISFNTTVVTTQPIPGIQQQQTIAFQSGETVVGPGGSATATAAGPIDDPTVGVVLWDEEIINTKNGYPQSCFVDQFRLGFCDFPSIPNAVAWSAINSPTDLYVATNPANAMFEVAPDDVRIYYVKAGAESSEFVFCDRKLYYIKIDASNPLKPGSVQFQVLSGDGCAQVIPRLTEDVILYVNAGRNSVKAITAPGNYYRPFNTKSLTDFHNHLFNNIVAIAAPTADGTFNERYAYVLNGDGSIVVGKYALSDGQVVPTIGWGPWSGNGVVKWVAAAGPDVLFTTAYFLFTILEVLDDNQYLDAAISVNALPAAFAPPAGLGPLWFIAGQSVSLMDQVTRYMGVYQIDAKGNIIPQGNGGENLLLPSLVAGQAFTCNAEGFAPDAQPGADVQQRMNFRYVARAAAAVVHSTGFKIAKLFSGKMTATSPPPGTVMNFRRFMAYNVDDNPLLPPPSRETVESWRPSGGSYDPRIAYIRDVPGPMLIEEIDYEVSL
jgi:hypothetical protein